MPLDFSRRIVARWSEPDPKHVALLQEAAIQVVITPSADAAFSAACRAAGLETAGEDSIHTVELKDLGRATSGKPVVLKDGLWPGISRGPSAEGRGDETATASTEPWVDADGFWVSYLRAMHPDRPALLGYVPDLGNRMVPFSSLELALVDAWDSGGNYILTVEPRFRRALLAGDAKGMAAWQQLGRTARWLQEHANLFGQPIFPTVTLLVEEGEATPEIANLMFRRGACPALVRSDQVPAPDPERRRVVVAVELKEPAGPLRNRILAHAEAGAGVVVNGSWWRNSKLKLEKKQEDRDFYTLGRGRVIAYHDTIADPSEFGLDVIDIVTHARRAVRIWNAPAAIPMATGKGLLHVVNYGSPVDNDVQARIQGHFSKATWMRPEAPPRELKASRRGSMTEVMIPELHRLAVVVFG